MAKLPNRLRGADIWARSLVCVGVVLGGCERRVEPSHETAALASAASAVTTPVKSTESPALRACSDALKRLEMEPALVGAAVDGGFVRARLLGQARAEPVLFTRAPVFNAARASPEARQLRAEIDGASLPARAVERALSRTRKQPALAREVFLTEGYLYAEDPRLAVLYVNFLTLGFLFREPKIALERGRERFSLKRHGRDYEYEEGPARGQRASLLLFDRLWLPGKPQPETLHLDIRPAAAQSAADEIRIDRLTAQGAVAALRFGELWVPAALKRSEGALELECELVAPQLRAEVERAKDRARRRARVVDVLARVVKREVAEGLPFDEPKTEEGQQDGQLRPAWRNAYFEGKPRYSFNDDDYSVFDSRGRPLVPQVCIDFVTDTLERAGASWYRPRGERPERTIGRLNFDSYGIDNRRSVESFITFAAAHPEWFDVTDTPLAARIPFYEHAAFFADIFAHRDEYRPFDIVTIFGLRADGNLHSHSFFVADRDPVTGMPIAVVANAGRPRIRSWYAEMQNAPRRAIRAHIRPKLEWLESVVQPQQSVSVDDPAEPTGPAG